mgnify:CR=1 FL=1
MNSHHDLEEIGQKIVEMTDRVKVVHAAMPGSQAKWVLEVDDVRFNVVVTVDTPAAAPQPSSRISLDVSDMSLIRDALGYAVDANRKGARELLQRLSGA